MKYAPRPWYLSPNRKEIPIHNIATIRDSRGGAVGTCWVDSKEALTSAYMLAAAPDLYEACRAALAALNDLYARSLSPGIREKLQAAIAQAEAGSKLKLRGRKKSHRQRKEPTREDH